MNYHFFSDGATKETNPGPSGIAFVETEGPISNKELCYFYSFIGEATNNQAEMFAVKSIFNHVLSNQIRYKINNPGTTIHIYSDSSYVVNTLSKWIHGWVKSGKITTVKNSQLWMDLYERMEVLKAVCTLKISHVKGHSDVFGNEMADYYANLACETKYVFNKAIIIN